MNVAGTFVSMGMTLQSHTAHSRVFLEKLEPSFVASGPRMVEWTDVAVTREDEDDDEAVVDMAAGRFANLGSVTTPVPDPGTEDPHTQEATPPHLALPLLTVPDLPTVPTQPKSVQSSSSRSSPTAARPSTDTSVLAPESAGLEPVLGTPVASRVAATGTSIGESVGVVARTHTGLPAPTGLATPTSLPAPTSLSTPTSLPAPSGLSTPTASSSQPVTASPSRTPTRPTTDRVFPARPNTLAKTVAPSSHPAPLSGVRPSVLAPTSHGHPRQDSAGTAAAASMAGPRTVVTSSAPVMTSAAPVVTSAAPVVTSAAPVVTSAAPLVTSAGPLVTSAAPLVTSAAPLVTSAAPIQPVPAVYKDDEEDDQELVSLSGLSQEASTDGPPGNTTGNSTGNTMVDDVSGAQREHERLAAHAESTLAFTENGDSSDDEWDDGQVPEGKEAGVVSHEDEGKEGADPRPSQSLADEGKEEGEGREGADPRPSQSLADEGKEEASATAHDTGRTTQSASAPVLEEVTGAPAVQVGEPLETAPTESAVVPPETEPAPTESAAVPTQSETAPTEIETAPRESETVPTESEAVPTEGDTVRTESEAVPTESEPASTETETAPTESAVVPTETMAVPTESETASRESETAPTESATVPTESDTDDGDFDEVSQKSSDLSPRIALVRAWESKPTSQSNSPYAAPEDSRIRGI